MSGGILQLCLGKVWSDANGTLVGEARHRISKNKDSSSPNAEKVLMMLEKH